MSSKLIALTCLIITTNLKPANHEPANHGIGSHIPKPAAMTVPEQKLELLGKTGAQPRRRHSYDKILELEHHNARWTGKTLPKKTFWQCFSRLCKSCCCCPRR